MPLSFSQSMQAYRRHAEDEKMRLHSELAAVKAQLEAVGKSRDELGNGLVISSAMVLKIVQYTECVLNLRCLCVSRFTLLVGFLVCSRWRSIFGGRIVLVLLCTKAPCPMVVALPDLGLASTHLSVVRLAHVNAFFSM